MTDATAQPLTIRPFAPEDRGRVVELLETTGVLRNEEIGAAERALDIYTSVPGQRLVHIFLGCEPSGLVVGYISLGPILTASGTWQLTLVAVDPTRQGHGIGHRLFHFAEELVQRRRARLLFAEVPSAARYDPVRQFCRSVGFATDHIVKDFYAEGEDKLILRKVLSPDARPNSPRRRPRTSGRNIVLFGFMGTGKTAVGTIVAKRLDLRFVDMDDVIEEREKTSISDIFAKWGEPYFRMVENEVVRDLASEGGLVIAAGGGAVLNADNIRALEASGLGICLNSPAQTIYDRVKGETHRPLLKVSDPLEKIRHLLAVRAPCYAQVAHQIDTQGFSPDAIADRVLALFRDASEAGSH